MRRSPTDALLLVAAIAVPLLAGLMSTGPADSVSFIGLNDYPLPPLCPIRWIGLRCPTCGVTRSIVALVHGDLAASLAHHRLGGLILLLILSQIPYRAWRLLHPERRCESLEQAGIVLLVATGILVFLNRLAEALGA